MLRDRQFALLTVDVEDWFHLVGAGANYQFWRSPGGVETWDRYPSRVVDNTRWILDLLEERNLKATFFVMGWVAEQSPELVRDICSRGHEIASHGYWHKLVTSQSEAEFRDDLQRSLDILQDITGTAVRGFRATSYSITDWAIDIVAEKGLTYDSSLLPASIHDVYGSLSGVAANPPVERLQNGLLEVKLSSLSIGRLVLPWNGGGYFRLFPYPIFKRGAQRILRSTGLFHFIIHPWELDSAPPRLAGLKPHYHIRRYVSIHRTRERFRRLLSDFDFLPIRDYLNTVDVPPTS
jgi:polysaccharide deacetylase family protein (PEP-CTERM system associated)